MIGNLIYLAISILLSALCIVVAINLARERSDYLRSLASALLINFLISFVLFYFYLSIPFFSVILEILVWILVIKAVFMFSWKNSAIVGVLAYAIKFALDVIGVTGLIMLVIG